MISIKKSLTRPLSLLLVLVIIVLLIPLVTQDKYYLHILIIMAIFILLTASLRLIFLTGQPSLGHSAFMAIGAYTSAVLAINLGLSFWLALIAAGVTAGIAAALIGIPILRLKGIYFFLVTFAFVELVRMAFNTFWRDVLGGPWGKYNIPGPGRISIPGLFTVNLGDRIPFYYLTVVLVLISLIILYRIERSRMGLVFKAIGGTDDLAEHVGIHLMGYKVFAFAIGCFFAGIAGSVYAHYHGVITPPDFGWVESNYIIFYMIVGGVGSFAGPVLGASVLTFARTFFSAFPYYTGLTFGILLIAVMMFMPEGLVGGWARLSSLAAKLLALSRRQSKGEIT